jgi:predicted acetyltransferase
MVLGLMVGAKADDEVERTEPGEFRVLEEGGEIVSLLRLDHQGGVPLATLTPSTFPFYRGAGFEVASSWTMYEASAEHLPRHTAPYRARPMSLDDPADVYRRVAPSRHGAFERGERFWRQLARRAKDKTTALYALPDRFARLTDRWHWMLRLVDLPAALSARPWPAGVAGQLELRVCPWNAGAWRLELAGGQGRVEPASAAPAAVADIRGLASLFTGFAGPDDLVRAGLLSGFDPDGVDLLRAAFASPRPWTAEFY